MNKHIVVNGARENNLKDISITIPHNKHTVISGVSGSGKSTLAYDVIFAEGQKRLLDCLPNNVKLFSSQLKQPNVNYVDGLTPVISLKQLKPYKNPRATIGTSSGISNLLRHLFSLKGIVKCPYCNKEFYQTTSNYLIAEIEKLNQRITIEVLIPLIFSDNKKLRKELNRYKTMGYKEVVINSKRYKICDKIKPNNNNVFIVHDVLTINKKLTVTDRKSLKQAQKNGNGFISINVLTEKVIQDFNNIYCNKMCNKHSIFALDISPSLYNFNDINTYCDDCKGIGYRKIPMTKTFIKNEFKPLKQGPFHHAIYDMRKPYNYLLMYSLTEKYNIDFNKPLSELTDLDLEIIFYGSNEKFTFNKPNNYKKKLPNYVEKLIGEYVEFEGLAVWLARYYSEKMAQELSETNKDFFNKYMINKCCDCCLGTGLKQHSNYIYLSNNTYNSVCNLELSQLHTFILSIQSKYSSTLYKLINEIKDRINILLKIGLGYLTLSRKIDSLSGGEYQRLRIATQLGSGLTGLTYIIDEPSVGLHVSDNKRVINLLNSLCKKGNTVITIEHDLDIIKSADNIIELGKGAAADGGSIIASGKYEDIIKNRDSLIANYLINEKKNISSNNNHLAIGKKLKIIEANANNLSNVTVEIPLNMLVCVTGVSGSGKSTLIIEVLYKEIYSRLYDNRVVALQHKEIVGLEHIKDIYCVDQSGLKSSSRSIPATYIGIMENIRELFAQSDSARTQKLSDKAYFSFNSKGGCSYCRGLGYLNTHIHYIGELSVPCPECHGDRFSSEVLNVFYKNKNIKQVLDMTFNEALSFFYDQEYIYNKIKYVCEIGLGYMSLGQSTNTISGGEAQRLCLAKEISKVRSTKNILYILDEPTTGLHLNDIEKLLISLKKLVEKGNSVIVIEHNSEVILNSDYIIDMGPEAGQYGGSVVFTGAPSDLINCQESKLGQYLQEKIK